MSTAVGKYQHYRNENVDEYFTAVGVPYVGRKMMALSSPVMEVRVDASGAWLIRTTSLIRTVEQVFRLGEPYDEHMPNKVIKSVTRLEGDELVTESVIPPDSARAWRRYTFTDTECVVTLTHESCATAGKRYFRRVKE